ncbi:unnamed protein product [Candida verbasci]|uniref:Uncharacterized protein n=1 Tax=Candida verbasci TaxID=1227364 RepID=A0A9W4XGZ7_9ASCO|nr:unnamed protein product [Candida verbasci]
MLQLINIPVQNELKFLFKEYLKLIKCRLSYIKYIHKTLKFDDLEIMNNYSSLLNKLASIQMTLIKSVGAGSTLSYNFKLLFSYYEVKVREYNFELNYKKFTTLSYKVGCDNTDDDDEMNDSDIRLVDLELRVFNLIANYVERVEFNVDVNREQIVDFNEHEQNVYSGLL